MQGIVGVWRATALGAACVLSFPTMASGQAAKAGVVTTLQGTATVARSTAAPPAPLKFRDDVFIRDHIVTGERSIVRILLGGKAVVTVRERSALTIHETPTTSTIQIDSGKMALAVAKDRMKPGEAVLIKTPNAMAGVRGTVVIADVTTPAPAGGVVTTRFTLLTGLVDVARLDTATGQATGQRVTLQPLQTITVTGSLPPGAVRTIGGNEAQSIAADYKVALPPPPPPANTQVTEQQIEIAVQHSAAVAGAEPGARVPGADEAGSDPTRTIAVGASATGWRGTGGTSTLSGSATVGGLASVGGGVSAGGGTIGVSTNVAVGGSTLGAGANVTVGGSGGTIVGGSVSVGGIVPRILPLK